MVLLPALNGHADGYPRPSLPTAQAHPGYLPRAGQAPGFCIPSCHITANAIRSRPAWLKNPGNPMQRARPMSGECRCAAGRDVKPELFCHGDDLLRNDLLSVKVRGMSGIDVAELIRLAVL